MKKFWFIFFSFLFIISCNDSNQKTLNPLSLVPNNTDIIIKVNSAEGLENGLKNNALIRELENYAQVENFSKYLIPVHHINIHNSIIALSKDSSDSLEISYIIPNSKQNLTLDSIPNLILDSSYRNRKGIHKILFSNKSFYTTYKDSILFVSNKLKLAEQSLLKKSIDLELETLYNTSDNEKMVSILINHKNSNSNPLIFTDSTLNTLQFSNYTMIDSDISQKAILFNGITKANDSTKSLINIFNQTIPQENKIANISPSNISSFKSITFDNYQIFKQNLAKHQFQDSVLNPIDFFQNIIEVGEIKSEDKTAVICRSIDPSSTFEDLNAQVIAEQYRDLDIYNIEDSTITLNEFYPIIDTKNSNYCTIIEDFFVFSDDIPFLKSIISNFQNNSTLSKSEAYKEIQDNLSDESSLLIFGNSTELNSILNSNFTDDKKLNISDYKTSAIQFIYDTNFAHINAILKTHKNRERNNTVSEDYNISLDADLLTTPQLVKNHTNNQMDIVAQDTKNNLYLISNKGKVFWKKQLEGKILGNIQQIDIYKNGRLQLVFNTSKRLYVLDRNGKEVKPFSLTFNNDITQPVAVFDYDKNKNYRLMITQGQSVFMYDKSGKIVPGFTYKSAQNTISSQPKHFRINRKDYIVFPHGNKLEILDRTGKQRIKVKENISFSNNEIYQYKNRFTTSNTNGELLEIDQKGNTNHTNLNANSEHKITTTSRTLAVMNDNKLTIKSNTITLDFGEYTAPKIFYINDKIYVTVTDLQSKKGYLFDSQAKPIANFPVYANSSLELNNIDKDRALEVITKGDNNAIIIYEIQ